MPAYSPETWRRRAELSQERSDLRRHAPLVENKWRSFALALALIAFAWAAVVWCGRSVDGRH